MALEMMQEVMEGGVESTVVDGDETGHKAGDSTETMIIESLWLWYGDGDNTEMRMMIDSDGTEMMRVLLIKLRCG